MPKGVTDKRKSLQERFDAKVDRSTDACWHWMGSHTKTGHGTMRVSGLMCLAHRVAYELYIGPIPKWYQVNHTCHVSRCVNPEHLYLGTQQDNMSDALASNRLSGIKGDAPVSMTQIQPLLEQGLSYTAIGCELGVTGQYIGRLVNGRQRGKRSRNEKYVVYERQKGVCSGCGEVVPSEFAHLDHIVPRSKGGTDDVDNLQILCIMCNSLKGANSMDYLQGRLLCGERSAEPKQEVSLTDAEVAELRQLYAEGWRQIDLTKKYGVCQSMTHSIVHNKTRRAPVV